MVSAAAALSPRCISDQQATGNALLPGVPAAGQALLCGAVENPSDVDITGHVQSVLEDSTIGEQSRMPP